MPNFPAVSMGSMVVGVDLHALVVPPAPAPAPNPRTPVGPLLLWTTPRFPMSNVFVNGMPACTVGAVGYSLHPPLGAPVNPTNMGYWKRYLTNVAMGTVLMALTTFANMAIAALSALVPKPKFAEDFIKDVTGIDTGSSAAFVETCKASFATYTQWMTWAKLLMPPLPFPGSQGSVAVGSPNVTANGGALAFVGPLLATSCSDIPVVPNAATLGFSNVMVGVSIGDLVRGIAVSAAQAGVSAGLQAGVNRAMQGRQGCGCR